MPESDTAERVSIKGETLDRLVAQSLPMALTSAEVAEALHISVNQVLELVASDRIPYVRFGKSGRTLRFPASALLRWLDSRANDHATV